MASVLITGTSKGIGFEAALAFGRAGHVVHATMRNPSRAPELAETAAREGLPITVSTIDVDSDESVSEGIAQIHKDHGPIDVLVNNAGVERVGSVEELSLGDFRAIMETNYFGAIRCIQAVGGADAGTTERLHYQRDVDRRAHRKSAADAVHRFQMGAGGVERGAGRVR